MWVWNSKINTFILILSITRNRFMGIETLEPIPLSGIDTLVWVPIPGNTKFGYQRIDRLESILVLGIDTMCVINTLVSIDTISDTRNSDIDQPYE